MRDALARGMHEVVLPFSGGTTFVVPRYAMGLTSDIRSTVQCGRHAYFAYALSGGSANLIAIMVGVFLTGNVFVDENFGAALIVGMIAIILVAFIMRSVLERRTAKWLQ